MAFDIRGFYNKHKDYYGDAPLDKVAKDVYTRAGYDKEYPDFDTWAKQEGVDQHVQEDLKRRNPPKEGLGTELLRLPKSFLQGAAEGITTELPSMGGGAIEFAASHTPFKGIEETGKSIKDWAEEKRQELYGPEIERTGLDRIVYEGTKMLAPSLLPGGIVGTAARGFKGVSALAKAGKVAEATAAAKSATNVAGGSVAALFGLSQAQQTKDTAEAAGVEPGIPPYLTGAIEAAGEFLGTKYLAKLFRLDEAEVVKRGAKELAKDLIKTVGVEVGTEIGQAGGEAAVEKYSGIRPNASPIGEAIDVIGPTIFMTLLTAGLAGGANKLRETDPESAQYLEKMKIGAIASMSIKEGLATGQLDGDPFTPENALEIIREGQNSGIYDNDSIERFKERYPQLRDGLNGVITESLIKKIDEVASPEPRPDSISQTLADMERIKKIIPARNTEEDVPEYTIPEEEVPDGTLQTETEVGIQGEAPVLPVADASLAAVPEAQDEKIVEPAENIEGISFKDDVTPSAVNDLWGEAYAKGDAITEKNKPLIENLQKEKAALPKGDRSGRKAAIDKEINILKEEATAVYNKAEADFASATEDYVQRISKRVKDEGIAVEEDEIYETVNTLLDGRSHDFNSGKTWNEPLADQVLGELRAIAEERAPADLVAQGEGKAEGIRTIADTIYNDNKKVNDLSIQEIADLSADMNNDPEYYKNKYDDAQHLFNIISDKAGEINAVIASAQEPPAPLPKPPEDSISGKMEAAGEVKAEVKDSEAVAKEIHHNLVEYKAELINKLARLNKEKAAAKSPRESTRVDRLITATESELDRFLRERTLPKDRIDLIKLRHGGKVEAAGAVKPEAKEDTTFKRDTDLYTLEALEARLKSITAQLDKEDRSETRGHRPSDYDKKMARIRKLNERRDFVSQRIRDAKAGKLVAPEPKPVKPVKPTPQERHDALVAKDQEYYNGSPSRDFIESNFAFENLFNKTSLARYLDGTEKEYSGLVGWKWQAALDKMGMPETLKTKETTRKEIAEFIKEKYLSAQPATKVIPATKTSEKNVTTPKEQKKYLLEKIDEALKDAPDVPVDIPYRNTRHARSEDYDRWAKEDRQLFDEYKEKLGTVIIEVPNDGTFTILNTKTSLENFKKQTSKFPASVIKGVPELKTPMPSKRATGKRLELEGVSYYNDFKPRKQDIIPSDNDAHNYYADGYYTQGHYLVKSERPKGIKISEETKDVKRVIPSDKDLIAADIVAEYNYGGGEHETTKVHIITKDGREVAANAHYVDVILTKHPNAKVFVKKEGTIPPIVFKDGKDVVGVLMPVKGEIPSEEFIAEYRDAKFQRGTKSTGLQQPQVQTVINKALESIPNAPKVNVVQSNQNCPIEVQEIMEREGIDDAMGFTHNGEVYLVADNLRNQEEALRTLAHELTHSGLGKFFQRQRMSRALVPVRAQYEALMDAIYRAHHKEIEQLTKTTHTHLNTRTAKDRRQACEEWLCNQSYEAQPKWYDKLVAIFNDLLRAVGLDVKLSDAEVRVVLQDAFKEFGGEGVSFMTAWQGSPHRFNTEGQEAADIAASAVEKARKVARLRSLETKAQKEMLTDGEIKETKSLIAEIYNKPVEKPAESATIPDVTTPKGTADIPAKTTPQAEAGNPFKDSVVKEPLYRGDTIAVEEFDKSKITNADFRAFFFTKDKTYAPIYAHHKPKGVLESNLSPTVRQAYINLKKPLDLRDKLSDHPDLEIIDKELYTYFQKRNTVGDFLESVVQEKTSEIEQQPFQGLNALLDGSEEGAKKYRESYNRIIKDRGFDTSGDYENARDTIEYLRRFRRDASFEITDVIESLGYDGLIRPETFNKFGGPNSKGDVSYAVFNNDQIKLLPNLSRPPEVGGQTNFQRQEKYSIRKQQDPPTSRDPKVLNLYLKDETDALIQTMMNKLHPPHMTWLETILKSPEWFGHPQIQNIVKLFMRDRNEIYHETFNDLNMADDIDAPESTVTEAAKALKNKGLSMADRLAGKVSPEYQRLQDIIDEGDTSWKRNTSIPLDQQIKEFEKHIRQQGATEDTIRVWKLYRQSYDKALDLQTAQLRQMIEEITEEANFRGEKPDLNELRQTLKGALAQMEEWRGFYAPRLREQGNWKVQAYKEHGPMKENREWYREHRGSELSARRLANKMQREGWKIFSVGQVEKLPETIYQDVNATATAKLIDAALEKLSKKSALSNELTLKFNEEVLREVSNAIKARGFRSTMIRRGEKVVRGFIEDPIQRHLQYTNSLSGGIAKARVARMAMKEMLGEKFEGKQIGGIDPVQDPKAFQVAQNYIEEQLRNVEPIDRMIGLAKSIATFKFLGFNTRSLAVNTTAIITTAPAAIHQYALGGKGSLMGIIKELAVSGKDYGALMAGRKLANADEHAFLDEVQKKGWDDAQYTREALGELSKTHSRIWSSMMDGSMYLFGKSEKWNRGTTMLAAYRLARKQGMGHVEAAEVAKEASDKAHGVYGKSTMPMWAQGTNPAAKLGQLFYVYQKFGHNYLQMLYDMGLKKHNIKGAMFAFLSPLVLAGGAALPFKDAIFSAAGVILSALFGEDRDPEKWVWDEIRKHLGMDAEKIGRHGLTGALGVDISSSLSAGVGIPKNFIDLTGAIGGVATELKEAKDSIRNKQYGKAAEHLLPTGFANPIRAIREAGQGVSTRNNRPVWDEQGRQYKPSPGATVARAVGFRSTDQAVLSERTWEGHRQQADFADKRDAIYERYRAWMLGKRDREEYKEIVKEVQDFNRKIREQRIPGVSQITSQSLQNQARRMAAPSKNERALLRN